MNGYTISVTTVDEEDIESNICDTCTDELAMEGVLAAAAKHCQTHPGHMVVVTSKIRRLITAGQHVQTFKAQPFNVSIGDDLAVMGVLMVLNGFKGRDVWAEVIDPWQTVETHRADPDVEGDRSWFTLPHGHKFTQDPTTGEWAHEKVEHE